MNDVENVIIWNSWVFIFRIAIFNGICVSFSASSQPTTTIFLLLAVVVLLIVVAVCGVPA